MKLFVFVLIFKIVYDFIPMHISFAYFISYHSECPFISKLPFFVNDFNPLADNIQTTKCIYLFTKLTYITLDIRHVCLGDKNLFSYLGNRFTRLEIFSEVLTYYERH